MKLPEKIQRERKKMGLSQEKLAEKIGVSRQAITKSALSLLSKMMWGITLVLPLLQQPSPAEKRRTVCLPISYLRMCRGLRLPLCFCWNNCGQ